jgi:hypothetical protein
VLKLIDGGGDMELRRGRWLMGDSKDRENKPINITILVFLTLKNEAEGKCYIWLSYLE